MRACRWTGCADVLLLDVNVVLALHRADHPQHTQARTWFDSILADGTDFGVPSAVWASFLRISTNRRVFAVPTGISEAFEFLDAVRQQPGHVPIEPGDRHITLLRQIAEEAEATGDLIPDAVLAATAREAGARIATFDRDFARFDGVETTRPG